MLERGGGRERGLQLDEGLVVGVCIVEKRTSLIRIRMDNLLGHLLTPSEHLKKFSLNAQMGSIKLFIEESALSLFFFNVYKIWLKRGKSSSSEVSSALWESL